MKALYDGFDLTSPTTSVSMTINGPAPTILAFFLNTAIDQQVRPVPRRAGPRARRRRARGARRVRARQRPRHRAGRHPQGGPGPEHLHLLHRVLAADDGRHPGVVHPAARCATSTRSRSPATTSPRPGRTPSASSRSRSPTGSPTSSATSARGMDIDDFAPNLSFFFSNGMDAEYTVIGRVARRIWAVAMRDRYGANERSQKLKYHVQTSGRSLHAQEMDFNDIRTTLQALCALYDNANSLHTNAYDEAVTTPTEESVRRAHGDPADHQPRVGPVDEREPAAGLVRRRRAHRPGRGGRARRVRPDLRARRRAGRDGDRLPARADPGRVDALRAPQARRHAADRRREHLPRPRVAGRAAARSSSPAPPRPRSSASSTGSPTSRPRHADEAEAASAGCRTWRPARATCSTS